MKKIIDENNILKSIDEKLYIVKQTTVLDNVLIKPIKYDKTIAICTKLSDAIKIKETHKDICIITEYN